MKTTKELARELGLLRKRTLSSSSNFNQKQTNTADQQFTYLIIIDFESTCWKDEKFKSQEIIEFPAVLLNISSGEIESEFHHYVQPQEQPTLSAFCTELTGITQDQVDDGIPISLCLKKFCHWLDKLHREKDVVCYGQTTPDRKTTTCTFVTWSDWDLGVCLQYECKRKQLLKPVQLNNWIDLRATYRKFYDRKPNGLNGALQDLGIEFEGREHSGLHDSRNTAKLAYRMIQDGCVMKVTKTMKNQENIPNKTPSVMKHFLPATRTTPPRAAKRKSPVKPDEEKSFSSPKQRTSSPNTHGATAENSRIPRPVSVSKSEGEQNVKLGQKSAVSVHTFVPNNKTLAMGMDTNSPATKRRKLSSANSPNMKYSNKASASKTSKNTPTGPSQKPKTPNKCLKKISPTKIKASEIYNDTVDLGSKIPDSRQNKINSSSKPGLKVQDLNVKVPANSVLSNNHLLSSKEKPQSSGTVFKTPLSASQIKHSGQAKSPVSSIKPRTNVNKKFQTSTPKVTGNVPKGFGKSLAPSPINSSDRSSNASYKRVVTPPSTPVNKQGQLSSFVTPAPSVGKSVNPGTTMFKTPSPVAVDRNSSAVFKMPSPVGSGMKSTPPLCKCGRRSKRRMVQSPGQNMGRFFFTCSVRHSAASKKGCDFFKWESSFSPGSNSSLTSKRVSYVSGQFTPVGGMSFKSTNGSSVKKNLGMRSVTVTPASGFRI